MLHTKFLHPEFIKMSYNSIRKRQPKFLKGKCFEERPHKGRHTHGQEAYKQEYITSHQEMHIKITMTHQLTQSRMATIQENNHLLVGWRVTETVTHSWRDFQLLLTPPLVVFYPGETNMCLKMGTRMFTVAFHKSQAEKTTQ